MGCRDLGDATVQTVAGQGIGGSQASVAYPGDGDVALVKRQRILIIHQNFPGQFLHIAQHLSKRPDVEVIGLGRDSAPGAPGVTWFKYKLHRHTRPDAHPYLRQMEDAVLHGQAVARAMEVLKKRGFIPDVILAHPGWGETLYAKEIFPQARLIHLCEWYYSTQGADFGFDPEYPTTLDDRLRITTWNALHLLNLQNCDEAIVPTEWQKGRHPAIYQSKLRVIHEGIDLAHLGPDPHACVTLAFPSPSGATPDQAPSQAQAQPKTQAQTQTQASVTTPSQEPQQTAISRMTLKAGDPVVTYVSRNLEPYRGFHTFMRALPGVLKAHPYAQILVIGGDSRSYGALPKDAPNWREKMLRELSPELGEHLKRIHFLGKVPYGVYKQILQVSAVHVYLTYPFVLSWSLLEAMAMGCRIIASDTAPVREVLRDQQNGELVDFFDTDALTHKILAALNDPEQGRALRDAAQQTAKAYGISEGIAAYEKLLGLLVVAQAKVSGIAT